MKRDFPNILCGASAKRRGWSWGGLLGFGVFTLSSTRAILYYVHTLHMQLPFKIIFE